MNLNHPGVDLLRDPEADILLALSRLPRGASGREIARLSGKTSHSSVRLALLRLSRVGLVLHEQIGNATVYRLNRAHIYWDAVFEILASPAKVEQKLGEIVNAYGNDNVTAATFGSFARQEAGEKSDLDVVIVVPDDFAAGNRERLVDQLTDELSELTGNAVQVVDVSEHALQSMVVNADPLIESWHRESRTIVGPPLIQRIAAARA
jgi:predicted nucleotidyltransferase